LAKVLFDQLQLPVIKKTKTGRSTDSDVLEELAETYPIATLLLEYRKLEKLLNTYVNALPQLVHPVTGKVHTSFNQTGAVTGRLSSTNPNLQNIPIRAPEGLAIRRAFIPSRREGLILSADYSQIELRLMAHLANDEAMLRAFRNNEDIHKSTAALIFGVPLDQVTKEQRYQAKAVNFGIIYGISPFGLSRNIGVSRADAKAIIDGYFVSFPGVKQFMDDTIEMARTDGKVLTEFGRVRPLPEMMDRNASKRQFAERTAINTRVQGTAADLIKLAMVKIYRRLNAEKFESKMMIQVHDELVFDCVPSEMDRLKELVKTEMETAWEIQIPLVADTSVGANWEEA
jgi:DNA polymerase-1